MSPGTEENCGVVPSRARLEVKTANAVAVAIMAAMSSTDGSDVMAA